MTSQSAEQIVTEIFSLYERYGNQDYIGEPVSQLEHMCQAAELARAEGYDDEVVLAAFFHDIGHLCEHIMPVEHMDGYGVADHEVIAGHYLREKGFSGKIARLVESHVLAKRYLTNKIPGYYSRLSAASQATLAKQGGPMQDAEARLFEQDPLFPLFIKMRDWDDRAKEEQRPLPDLGLYKAMALAHLVQ